MVIDGNLCIPVKLRKLIIGNIFCHNVFCTLRKNLFPVCAPNFQRDVVSDRPYHTFSFHIPGVSHKHPVILFFFFFLRIRKKYLRICAHRKYPDRDLKPSFYLFSVDFRTNTNHVIRIIFLISDCRRMA